MEAGFFLAIHFATQSVSQTSIHFEHGQTALVDFAFREVVKVHDTSRE